MHHMEKTSINEVLENSDVRKVVLSEDENFVIKTLYDKINKWIIVEEKDKRTGVQSESITKIGVHNTSSKSA